MTLDDKTGFCGKNTLSMLVLLVVVTLGAYSVSLSNGFVWDDELIIVNNPDTRQLSTLSDVLFSPDFIKPYYRPLNRASYLLDYQLYGMHPAGFHAVNIVLHLLNVLLFYLLGRRIFAVHLPAFFAALIFAVHPVNTEAVNFISGRNNLLSLFFMLSSFLLFLRGKELQKWRWYLLSALLFFLGLLSKETTLMVLVPIVLYSYFPLLPGEEKGGKGNARFLAPYVAASIAYLLMRNHALNGVLGTDATAKGLMEWVALNYYIIPNYVLLMVFPRDLTVFHSIPNEGLFTIPWLAAAWVTILFTLWLLIRQKSRAVIFGLLWFGANYLPVANIIPIPSNPMAERFLYIPAVGLWLIAGEYVWRACLRVKPERWRVIAVLAMVIALGGWTVTRNLEWRDDFSLFRSTINTDPRSAPGHYNLGCAFRVRGDLAAAQREWEYTLKIDPEYPEAFIQLGTLAARQGDLVLAKKYYLEGLRVYPGNAMAHYNLGKIFEREGRPDLAVEQYELFLQYVTVEFSSYIEEVKGRMSQLRSPPPNR